MTDAELIKKYISRFYDENDSYIRIYLQGNKDVKKYTLNMITIDIAHETRVHSDLIKELLIEHMESLESSPS